MNSDEVVLRYVIFHDYKKIKTVLNNILKNIKGVQTTAELEGIVNIEKLDINNENGHSISRIELMLYNADDYNTVIPSFEEQLTAKDGVKIVIKVYDSYKLAENQRFLGELYELEMKIREIFTVLIHRQNVHFGWSEVNTTKEFKENPDQWKKMLMNEFFFIGFSGYKNVDKRRRPELSDVLEVLKSANSIDEINQEIMEITQSTLGLSNRFPELNRVIDAVSRLEHFRNTIAHNRYLSKTAIDNFYKAKEIIEKVYSSYIKKFREGNI